MEMAPAEDSTASAIKPSKHRSRACAQAQPPVQPEIQPIPFRGLVFLVMIALMSFSISVRASQVNGVLHKSNGSAISNMSTKTKTDVPAAAPIRFEPALRVVSFVLPQPRLTGAGFERVQRSDVPLTESLWYSVAVRYRPPPAFLS
jgi:hypothetical protein